MNHQFILDDFSPTRAQQTRSEGHAQNHILESECFLMTKADRFRKHWIVLMGNEIYFYRSQNDQSHIFMHSLASTFIRELTEDKHTKHPNAVGLPGPNLFPIKIVFMPTKSRILYFA